MTDSREAFSDIPSEEINLSNKKKNQSDDKVEKAINEIKKKYGVDLEPAKSGKYKIEKAMKYLNSKYRFRFNVITKQLEYCQLVTDEKKNVELKYRDFDNRDFLSLLIEIKRTNIVIGKEGLKDLLNSRDMSNDFDPFKAYLLNLPRWDDQTDHIKKFLQQVQLVNEQDNREDFIQAFKKWIVAMVASLICDTIINEWILVFTGKEGIFKTTFLNSLVPPKLRMDYLYSAPFNFENKDHLKYLWMKMLINLDELARFNRTDESLLKTILSEPRPAIRLPYGEFDTKMCRKASFCGSTNHRHFLKDETGSRRFLVFEIENITPDETSDLDLIYSQAVSLFKKGFKYWFDYVDNKKTEIRNVEFHDTSIEEDLINQYIEMPAAIEIKNDIGFKWMSPTSINIELVTKSNSRINVNESTKKRIGLILAKLGFLQKRMKVNGKLARLWAVRFVDSPSIQNPETSLFKNKDEDII